MSRQKAVNERSPSKAPGKKSSRPKLGQNFLADKSSAARIVDALGDISSSVVLEIGPGRGVLTETLAQRARRLIAVEIDRLLAVQLRVKYGTRENVEIVEGDFLAIDLNTLLGPKIGTMADRQHLDLAHVKVIGNLPYYITSDILLRLFSYHHLLDSIVIMVQREVGDRIAAKPGTRDYGLLSVTAQFYTDVENLFTLPPGAFAPPPKVHSTVLRMKVAPKAGQLGVETIPFISFLKLNFGQKRKTLLNNLKQRYPEAAAKAAIKAAGIRPDIRAENLSLRQFAEIFHTLKEEVFL
ncbi:MAG TPA: 16S rRNA (adenine(1518)-N(6)/adenine(1519)-N(6))-dimethyltransferase RsmA [Terriglobales bacterium]